MIKVLQFGTLDVHEGGPALSTYLTMKGANIHNALSTIIMPPLVMGSRLISESIDYVYTSPVKYGRFEYIPNLIRTINTVGKVDLFHIQGLWRYIGAGASYYARKHKIPYIITLRGMMYPQSLGSASLIKKISLALYQRNDLKKAACIQATCKEEMQYYRALGFTNPVAVIPNPIDISKVIARIIPKKPIFRIGYLGRVHPRKRIERLIYTMDALRHRLKNAELVIIGSGDKAYEEFLHNEVKRLNLDNIRFTGFLIGDEKDKEIIGLSVLAVPSDFENFGNIVPEALVRGVPVIATTGMPWEELELHNCGWWVNNDQESINKTILESYEVGENVRIQMGRNGKILIRNNYSVEVLGAKMKLLYEWILGRTTKPDFVYEN